MADQLRDKDAYQRLNYLYQAAHHVVSQNPENVELARFYCFTQRTIARRLVLRQDPSVKRTICKKCCSLLIPGVTATTRQRRKKGKTRFTVVRCLSCGQSKTFLNNPDHNLWVDRPEAQLEHQTQPEKTLEGQKQRETSECTTANRKKNRRKRTGLGGTTKEYTPAEELALANNEGRSIMDGVEGGVASDPSTSTTHKYVQVDGDTLVVPEVPPSDTVSQTEEEAPHPAAAESRPSTSAFTGGRPHKSKKGATDAVSVLYEKSLQMDIQYKAMKIKKTELEIEYLKLKIRKLQQEVEGRSKTVH